MRSLAYPGLLIALFSTGSVALAASVSDIPNISDCEQADHTPSSLAANVNFEQYSSTIKTGGGNFVLGPAGCTGDDGVIIADHHSTPNCYYRQFSGPVHLAWYGVPDAADSGCYAMGFPSSCDATTKLNHAFAAAVGAGLGGDGGVTTDGRSIAILSHSPCNNCDANAGIEIPHDQYLTCDGPPGGTRAGSDYWTAPHSIVLRPPYTTGLSVILGCAIILQQFWIDLPWSS